MRSSGRRGPLGHGDAAALIVFALVLSACQPSAPEAAATPASTPAMTERIAPGAGPPRHASFHVAPVGDDQDPGTEARPFKTLQAAQAAVRALLAHDRRQDVRVAIAAGRYFLSARLSFDERDSPADGFTVTYAGPPDASAVLVGGRAITGWELVSGRIYRARLAPRNWTFSTLFENAERATLARHPNEGYLAVQGDVRPPATQMPRLDVPGGPGDTSAFGSRTQFVYAPGDIPEGFEAAAARVYLWSGQNPGGQNWDWEPDSVPLTSIDRSARTVTLAVETLSVIRPGNRYFIHGPLTLLDRPGEFALDEAEGYLYYWPRALPIERQEIVAPTVPQILYVRGSSPEKLVRGLTFERLTLTISDIPKAARHQCPGCPNAAVYLSNAEGVTVRFSKILHAGGSGVELVDRAQNNVVDGNLIEGSGVHGVFLHGVSAEARTHRANTVSRNRIRSGGRLHGGGIGVYVFFSGENRIEHNEISDWPRLGIKVSGTAGETLRRYPQQGPVPGEEWRSFATRDNIVRFNDVSRVLTDSQDGGGINPGGAILTLIENNRVHDIASAIPGGLTFGIYLDTDASWTLVRSNIVYGITGTDAAPTTPPLRPRSHMANPIFTKGVFNELTNNVFVSSAPNAQLLSFHDWVRHDHLKVSRNIFYAEKGADLYQFGNWSDDRVAEASANLFFHPGGSYSIRFGFGAQRMTLEEWRAKYGFDRDSVVADPLFVDPARGDYRVRSGSPALALGFVNIDTSKIGPLPDLPLGR